jgi:hypothetical protein
MNQDNNTERDPDFPNLPYIPDNIRSIWSEDEKFKRHCQEIEENALLFNQRLRDGMPPAEAAKLPVPWMNRHSLSELLKMQDAARERQHKEAGENVHY